MMVLFLQSTINLTYLFINHICNQKFSQSFTNCFVVKTLLASFKLIR